MDKAVRLISRNTVVIMTSNLGSSSIQENFAKLDYQGIKERVMKPVTKHFRPEFLNRVDESVVFHPLGREHIKSIASIRLERLHKRLAEKDYDLIVSEDALELIARCFDPVYGARRLKRAIQQNIENPLAKSILSGIFTGQTNTTWCSRWQYCQPVMTLSLKRPCVCMAFLSLNSLRRKLALIRIFKYSCAVIGSWLSLAL